jgi:hypothetical protein
VSPVIAPPEQETRSAADAEALFAEAHRRRRRRRLAGGVAGLVLAGSVTGGLATAWPRHGSVRAAPRTAAVARRAPGFTLPPVRVAWVDYGGRLHLGNLATGAQQVVAAVDAAPDDPMIPAGGHLYWADTSRNFAPVRDYDIATGAIRYLARGDSVFAAADGRHIYVAGAATRLTELPADGIGRPRRLALPAGWYLSGGLGNWSVAGGMVVYSEPSGQRPPASLAVWSPGTGRLKIIGRDRHVIGTYTAPGGRYSLVAWTSGGLLGITNTATLASRTVRSPYRHGFTYGGPFTSGSFSPDGKRLAVFLNLANPARSENVSVPAIVSTSTGAVRPVPAARLATTEDAGWARWLPGGSRLILGGETGSFAVDAVSLVSRS